jgi:histidine triad (HIT) family protein
MTGAKPESACRFCRIAAGEIPAAIVFEDESSIAFLDRRPLFAGHCLLIPRVHHATLPDLPPELVAPLFTNARRLARAVQQAMAAEGSFIAINNTVSQSVPHLHVHIVPRRKGDGLKGFFWPRHPYADEAQMLQVREAIREVLATASDTQLKGR